MNLTLQANPILANLLKTNTDNSNIFDTNFSVESLLMTALAANMEGYMRNITSMIKGEERGHLDHGNGHLDHDNGHRDHDGSNMDHDNGHIDHDRGSYDQNNDRGFIQDCQSTSQSVLINDSSQVHGVINNRGLNVDSNLFNDRTIDHYSNNTYDGNRSVRYYENDVNRDGSPKSDRCDMDHDRSKMSDSNDHMVDDDDRSVMDRRGMNDMSDHRGMMDHDRSMIDHDRGIMDHGPGMIDDDRCVGVTNDGSQGSSDEPICDNDLNESIDSNRLVIDETI